MFLFDDMDQLPQPGKLRQVILPIYYKYAIMHLACIQELDFKHFVVSVRHLVKKLSCLNMLISLYAHPTLVLFDPR